MLLEIVDKNGDDAGDPDGGLSVRNDRVKWRLR